MPRTINRFFAVAILAVFVLAQTHFCVDPNSVGGSHLCQICTSVGSVLLPHLSGIGMALAAGPLQRFLPFGLTSFDRVEDQSPRAPPSPLA